MENPTVSELRSRSRSKTPFLRSSCDRENCKEGDDHIHHMSGRKTPVKRSTPIKQLKSKSSSETIKEVEEEVSAPAHRTRQTTRTEKLIKTSDYSSEESPDRIKGNQKEMLQNELNSQYERVSTSTHGSQRYNSLSEVTFSPIQAHNVTYDRSTRFGSPAYSACSTDSSFAEQALADTSLLLNRDPRSEHLPYRLYKMAGEYWNKYPKTDYTYSTLSKDRVELAPGQVAVPNMSRRSLSQFRVQGPNTSADELDRLSESWTSTKLRDRYSSMNSSDEETYVRGNGGHQYTDRRWWITRMLVSILTTITSSYRRIVGPSHRYPYTARSPQKASVISRTASVAAAPFYWVYITIKKIVTTTVTTVTETVTSNHVGESSKHASRSSRHKDSGRRWWPWLLLLLLPALGYGSHYTYHNFDRLALPNFTDFQLALPEFTSIQMPTIALPNISLSEMLPTINLTMPDMNITLPDISEELPQMTKMYTEYKDLMADASEYMKVVAESCFEEIRRYWQGIIG